MAPNQLHRQDSPVVLHGKRHQYLSPAQIATWMQYGFVHVPGAFSHEAAAYMTRDVWIRLGFDAEDPRTWTKEVTNLHDIEERAVKVADFAPKAWQAICDVVGGADRIEEGEDGNWWSDGFIVNLGTDDSVNPDGENLLDARHADGWHVDGDFFMHFLDSREQGLLIVVLWGDVIENAGGTVICSDGIGKTAKWLHDHPEGVDENLKPVCDGSEDRWYCGEFVEDCHTFFELTGEAGDVFILHPFMIHSAAKNSLRIPRLITNPNVKLKEPFNYDRDDPSGYSLVELKTLQDLGQERLRGWRITGERSELKQEYWKDHERQGRLERQRLEAATREMIEGGRAHRLTERPPPIPPRTYLPEYAREYYRT